MVRARAALAGSTGPFLLERLGAAPGDLGPGLGALRTPASGPQLCHHHLVHEGDVRLQGEELWVQLNSPGNGPVLRPHLDSGGHFGRPLDGVPDQHQAPSRAPDHP